MRKMHLLAGLLIVTLVGCGGKKKDIPLVDLDKVLDVFVKVLEEPDPAASPDQENPEEPAEGEVAAIEPVAQDRQASQAAFLKKFAADLNAAGVAGSHTVGVSLQSNGSIIGFEDPNSNMIQDSGEEKLFLVEVDAENNRVVASDVDNHYRDQGYRRRSGGGGMFMGYMLGRMMSRQSANPGSKTYTGKKMSPKGYHKSLPSKTKSVASKKSSSKSSARSSGGSKSFRGGGK